MLIDMFIAIITVAVASLIFFVFLCVKWKQKFQSLEKIPGPAPVPIIGNLSDFGFNPVDQLKNLVKLYNLYGSLLKFWIGPKRLYILVSDPDFTELILSSSKNNVKSEEYKLFKPWLQNGLLISEGTYWQKHRKAITPTFHFKILEDFIPVFNKNGDVLVKRLSKEVGKNVCDIYPYITDATLDIICESAMGVNIGAQNNSDIEYVRAVKETCHIITRRVFSVLKFIDFTFQFTRDYQQQKKCLSIIHGFTKSVIQQRRKQLLQSKNEVKQNSEDDFGIKKKKAFLDLLLEAEIDGKPLTDQEIQAEVDTFMFEGHDTTASLIAFTMYELARNPDIQNKMVAELKEIFQDKDQDPTMQDLNNMKYTELVLKETLRMYPSVPYFGRRLIENVTYKGTVFPKDLHIIIFIYQLQRNAKFFSNPEIFNPDRFLPENNEVKNPFAYVPFSAGPRNCIGQKFAMHEMKSTLSKIVRNFELVPADPMYDPILSTEVILKSQNGVSMRIKNRNF